MKRFILITAILMVAAAARILPRSSTLLGAALSGVEGQSQPAPRTQTQSAPSPAKTPAGQLATAIQEGRRADALAMIKAGADVNQAQPDGTRPIHWAVYRVDHELVDALIAKKARVDVTNEFGHTPLAEAVRQGDARIVKALLAAGSGTEGANADGQTALMIAIKNGELPVFQLLVDAGAKVNVVEKVQDQTPLMWAAAANQNAAEMTKVLIAKGANVNARAKFTDWPSQITSEPRAQYHAYGGLTPLLYAARSGCYGCVDALVAARADVNLPTPEGVSPIMVALDNNHNGVARFLMEHGGNPHVWDVYGRTALYIAVGNATSGGGAGGGAPAGRGGAPGRGAPGAGAPGAGAGARGAGAVPAGLPNGLPNNTARAGGAPGAGAAPAGAGAAAGQGRAGRGGQGGPAGGRGPGAGARGAGGTSDEPQVSAIEMINLLLAAGVDTNAQLNMRRPSNQGGRFSDPLLSTGTTPLLRSLIEGNIAVARLLLEKGANPNIYGMGLSPWLYAAGITSGTFNEARGGAPGNVDTALLDLMLTHGADVNGQVTGASSYSGRLARALTGDPVNTKSNEGMTALHVAVRSRNASFVRYLLGKGARTDIKDGSGRTPLDVLNGVPALQPAIFAEADGLVPPSRTAAAAAPVAPAPAAVGREGAGREAAGREGADREGARREGGGREGAGRGGAGGGNAAAVQEIQTLLQGAPQGQPR
jgi:ankyrin repeat protein